MAPSNMFSYLRPGHAKRSAASDHQALSPSSVPLPSPAPSSAHSFSHSLAPDHALASPASTAAAASPISPFPPQLPPITRVASKLDRSATPAAAATPAAPPAATTSPALDSKPPFVRAHTDVTPSGRRPQGLGIQHKTDSVAADQQSAAPALSPSYAAHSRSQSSLMGGLSDKLAGNSRSTAQPGPIPAKSKSRLNLRNPMSLLMRRRSGQTLDPLHDESLVTQRSPSFVPPMRDNYDPSIRGNIVHDFNAPRLNRNFSYTNAYGNTQEVPGTPSTPADLGRVSPPKIEKEHTPVFHEHFDDDTSYEQSQAAVRAEQLANNDFVTRNSALFLASDPSPPEPVPATVPAPAPAPKPAPAPSPKEMLPEPPSQPLPHPPPPYQAIDLTSSILSPVEEVPSPTYVPSEDSPNKRKSTKNPPAARSRAASLTDPSWQPAGLPAHLSSRASRFSFQISGSSDSTQEKIMEERHRQKAAEKASKQVRMSTNTLDDEYDEYAMDDDFDMDGGYEEEIPMIGEEDEFTGLGNQSIQDGISTFDFSTLSINPGATGAMGPNGLNQTPYDVNGNVIGFAMSGNAAQPAQPPAYNASSGLPHQDAAPRPQDFDDFDLDDDMYFDDGMIGEEDFGDATAFNEDVFDDPNGPLYERKTKPPPADEVPNALSSHPLEAMPSEAGYEADDDTLARNLEKSSPSLVHKTSVVHPKNMPAFPSMDSYHNALVDAANRAEAEGRFARTASTDIGHSSSDLEDSSSYSNSRPSLVPEDTHFNSGMTGYPIEDDGFGMDSSFMDDYDYSEYDSNLEDDPMIAAANAEALAYDDEGFYGSEFGFYASGAGDGQNSWGGVFGASGVGRTVSGRNAVREPNLTPITERSEYSTRNSFISLHHFRDGTMPLASPMGQLASPGLSQLASPGLAQLARLSPYGFPGEDEDMRFEALMRLRKGAFGGSASSLPGSAANSPRTSSPMGMQFAPRTPGISGRRLHEHSESAIESDESANLADSPDENEQGNGRLVTTNVTYRDENDNSPGDERPESPTLSPTDHNSLASPTGNTTASAPTLSKPVRPQILQNKYMQVPSNLGPMSPVGLPLKSPSNIALPMSPFAMPLPSPFNPHHPASPPPIDTSLSSPAATSSTGPRRQSLGFTSPVSTSSPMTPNGSGWRGGHSRKGSAADSVTYVREHDEAGEGRWVLERRRTAESGELELVGREIVEGGRI